MKQSPCFQLRNRSLLKSKSSCVIAETAVQQPPKQAAVACAAVPEMSWLCICVSQHKEEPEEAQLAQKVVQGMPVDGFKLLNRALPESWCPVHAACLSFLACLTIPQIAGHCFNTSKNPFKALHLGMQGIQGEVSAISPQLLARGCAME